jgi:chromate transporter
LALGNALPGPIATKMAAYIGFNQAGLPGATIGVFATVAPSIILMIALLGILYKYKDSPKVKNMTMLIRPTIAVLLGILAFRFFQNSYGKIGLLQTIFLTADKLLLLEKVKIHPAIIIAGALVYGALVYQDSNLKKPIADPLAERMQDVSEEWRI